VFAEMLLQKSAERKRPLKHFVGCVQRKQTAGINNLQSHRNLASCRPDQRWIDVGGKPIRNNDTRVCCKCCQKSVGSASLFRNVGIIQNTLARESARVIRHTLHQELMRSIAHPFVSAIERFKDDEWFA